MGERGKQREPRISNQEIVILPTHSVCPARDLRICTPITVIRMTKIASCLLKNIYLYFIYVSTEDREKLKILINN